MDRVSAIRCEEKENVCITAVPKMDLSGGGGNADGVLGNDEHVLSSAHTIK
jgi:hypothetical protein